MGTTQCSCCKHDAVNERSRRKITSHNKIQALKLKRTAPQNYRRRSSKRRPSSIKSRAWADSIKHDPASNTSKRKYHEICSDDEHDSSGKLIHAALTTSTSSSPRSPMLPDQPMPSTSVSPTHSTTQYLTSQPYFPYTNQTRTTLPISLPSSSDVVPLKLRSCMTMASLFSSIIAICNHQGAVTKVRFKSHVRLEGRRRVGQSHSAQTELP